MAHKDEDPEFEAVGWRFALDQDAEEMHIEHEGSDTSLVLDDTGDLRMASDQHLDGELTELHSILAAALEDAAAEGGPDSVQAQTSGCRVECDQSTGAVVIESDTKVTIDAPQIELSAAGTLDIEANGILSIQGSLIKLN